MNWIKNKNGKIKPFWVLSVNNFICDASYDGKELKTNRLVPSFRKYYFIRDIDHLRYFTKRKDITNEEIVYNLLNPQPCNTP